MKKAKTKEVKKNKKKSFLTKRKTINDKFFDIVNKEIHKTPYKKPKKNKFGGEIWQKKGITKLAKELNITTGTLSKYIDKGFINENLYYLTRRIENKHKKLKIPKTKKVTKQFSIHTFTRNNFFEREKGNKKTKKNEMFYFRAGLYIVFQRVKKVSTGVKPNKNEKTNMNYTIQNFPTSYYSNNYIKGFEEFYEKIKTDLQNFPSLLYFLFNYFDVEKIDIGTVEQRIEKFKSKRKTKK